MERKYIKTFEAFKASNTWKSDPVAVSLNGKDVKGWKFDTTDPSGSFIIKNGDKKIGLGVEIAEPEEFTLVDFDENTILVNTIIKGYSEMTTKDKIETIIKFLKNNLDKIK